MVGYNNTFKEFLFIFMKVKTNRFCLRLTAILILLFVLSILNELSILYFLVILIIALFLTVDYFVIP
jgi:hypothetical protein